MGVALSYPITTQHVERHSSNYMRASCTHVNGWRNSQEDDHSLASDLNDSGLCIFAVYDGHGGQKAAQYCATAVPEALAQITDLSDTDAITSIMLQVDKVFLDTQETDGCTACIVLGQPWNLKDNKPLGSKLTKPLSAETKDAIGMKLLAINIGDSRAILLHPDGSFDQMTDDHKPQDPVERARIVNAGGTVQNNRVDGSLALSRAIGDAQYKNTPRLPPHEQKVIAVPDYQDFLAHYGDTLLVCCDGIFETPPMTHERVAQITHQCIEELINESLIIDEGEMIESKYQELLWDPALVGRRLISESIIYDSRDNHTAIVISFTPYPDGIPQVSEEEEITQNNTDLHVLQYLTNLPLNDTIPGPKYQSNDKFFIEAYDADYGADTNSNEDLVQDIQLIDEAVFSSKHELHSDILPCESTFEPDLHGNYSVPPIIIVLREEGEYAGIPPALLHNLFSPRK